MIHGLAKGDTRSDPPRFSVVSTPWGAFGLVMSPVGRLVATFLPQPENAFRRTIRNIFPEAMEAGAPASLRRQIETYFAGREPRFDVELDLDGLSEFRRRVLQACRRIAFGRTVSYADLARTVGNPGATRAVGSAMANNPIPLIVPCHRVLRSDGSLGGFSSPCGTSQKRRMLLLENPFLRIIE